MKKNLMVFGLVGVILLAGCSSATEPLTLTTAELAAYDGLDGQPAYVAVDGDIYDVTNVPEWQNATHQGYSAGIDLTNYIDLAPHGRDILDGLDPIGTVTD